MRAAERIGHPHGSVVRIVVIVTIVPVRSCGTAAAVELANEVFRSAHGRELQPMCGNGDLSFGSQNLHTIFNHISFVVVDGVGGEARELLAE